MNPTTTPHRHRHATRAAAAMVLALAALFGTGCAKKQISCESFAHRDSVPSSLRQAVHNEAAVTPNCKVTVPK